MAQQTGTPVTITTPSGDLHFNVTAAAFDTFQNEFLPGQKTVTPADNFLTSTVAETDKTELLEWCDRGYAIDLASMVAAEYKPAVEFKVKK